jgi:hypothetical protein
MTVARRRPGAGVRKPPREETAGVGPGWRGAPHLQTGRVSYLSPPRALGGGALPRERFGPLTPGRHGQKLLV